MRTGRFLLIVIPAFAFTGCASTLIFKSDLTGSGSPQGSPAGQPTGDQITVASGGNPLLTAGHLEFDTPSGSTFFWSRPVASLTSRKTIYFVGHLTSGDGPFFHFIQAYNSIGSFFPEDPLEVRFTDTTVEVRGPAGNLLHSATVPANQAHTVFVSLRLGTDTYRITIQHSSVPEIEFTGSLPPATANTLKRQRITLNSRFGPSASASDIYRMQDLIMREGN